jgi:hypothetical protein
MNAELSKQSYSEYSEAYGVPGDVATKGAKFLQEAERSFAAQSEKENLCTLQGTMILYERYVIFSLLIDLPWSC